MKGVPFPPPDSREPDRGSRIRNRFYLRGWVSPARLLASALCLFLGILRPMPCAGFDPDQDRLNVTIQIFASWSLDDLTPDRKAEGTASATITGTIERQSGFSLGREETIRYQGDLTANYRWDSRYYFFESCNDCCPSGLLARETGAGSAPVDHFRMQVHLGELGKKVAREKGCSHPVDGVYGFSTYFSFNTSVEHIYSLDSCYPAGWPWRRKTVGRGFSLGAHKVLDASGLWGSYEWKSREDTLEILNRDIDVAVWDHCGNTVLQYGNEVPENPQGNMHLRVSWRIGKVKPIIKIWQVSGEPRDITDALKDEVPAIIGRKVRLEARVFPPGSANGDGEWTIEGDPIADYNADDEQGEVVQLEQEDCCKKTIEFLWPEGSFEGTPRRVTYELDIPKGPVKGETLITVYEPKEKVETTAAEESTVGPTPDGCMMNYGRIAHDAPTGQWSAEPPGVNFTGEVTMPKPFGGRPYNLAWVQRIKEKRWVRLGHYRQGEMYFTWQESSNKKWCLDGHFPYAGKVGGEFQDSPGLELHRSTDEVHVNDAYQSDLVFLPCADVHDDRCAWVPLKRVEWNWKAGARRKGEIGWDPVLCTKDVYPLCYGPPAEPTVQDLAEHPEWDCNVEDNRWRDINEGEWNQGHGTCR
jgi:hypothetical protein